MCKFPSWFRQDHFFTGESNIMDRGLVFKMEATVWNYKHLNDGIVYYKHADFTRH